MGVLFNNAFPDMKSDIPARAGDRATGKSGDGLIIQRGLNITKSNSKPNQPQGLRISTMRLISGYS
jgi:hypothetical protein